MPSCDYEAISALVDDELTEDECQQLFGHLVHCPECRRLFERFHTTRNLVRNQGEAPLPEGLGDRILAALAEEAPHRPEATPPSQPNPTPVTPHAAASPSRSRTQPAWAWMATAAGVAGIAVMTTFLWSPSPSSGPQPASSPNFAEFSLEASELSDVSPSDTARDESSSKTQDMEAIQRYISEHSTFVSNGPQAEFQRAGLEVGNR